MQNTQARVIIKLSTASGTWFSGYQEAAIATKAKKTKGTTSKVAGEKVTVTKPPAGRTVGTKTAAAPKKKEQEHKLHSIVMKALDQDKGEDIVSIDLKGKTAIADFMVIVTGTSSRQVSAMAEKLKERLSKEGYRARIEGKETGDWVILDAGDVIVHLFRKEVREFYNLEKLWGSDFSTVGYNLYK